MYVNTAGLTLIKAGTHLTQWQISNFEKKKQKNVFILHSRFSLTTWCIRFSVFSFIKSAKKYNEIFTLKKVLKHNVIKGRKWRDKKKRKRGLDAYKKGI